MNEVKDVVLCSRALAWLLTTLSILHAFFLLPPKLTGFVALRGFAFLTPVTGLLLIGIAWHYTKNRRLAVSLLIVPLVASLKVYAFAFSKLQQARSDEQQAKVALVVSADGNTLYLGGLHSEVSRECVSSMQCGTLKVCSPTPWTERKESLGEEFSELSLVETSVEGVPIVVARVAVNRDLSPFGQGIIQLRRISSLVRHREGAVLLVTDGLPGMFSGPAIGFYQQAWVHELFLSAHFWRTISGVFPVRLVGRRLRLIE